MYQFKETCDQKQFFWWPKKLIENKNWAMLPAVSKAVWPVIASYCNQKGVAFPGERTIAILAGYSAKQTRLGIGGLEGFPGFEMNYYHTKNGRRSKKFHIELPSKNNNDSFPFYKFLLESGAWCELKPSAQALYPVMRYFSFFDLDFYSEIEGFDAEPGEFNEIYKNRKFDYCHARKDFMAELSGLNTRSIYRSLIDLEENSLIEKVDFETWKIFLLTKDFTIFKRSYLNQKIIDAYRHEL